MVKCIHLILLSFLISKANAQYCKDSVFAKVVGDWVGMREQSNYKIHITRDSLFVNLNNNKDSSFRLKVIGGKLVFNFANKEYLYLDVENDFLRIKFLEKKYRAAVPVLILIDFRR